MSRSGLAMHLALKPYVDQVSSWPRSGRHILASFDDETIIVYQAYRPSIARWPVQHGRLGGPEFSYQRMSWVKPNFLWMMYRSGWGTKENQEATLAFRVPRGFFDRLLESAVESSFDGGRYASHEQWKQALAASTVRMQWDPDHHPTGAPEQRRAVQLGLLREALGELGQRAILEVLDLSELVAEQRAHVQAKRLDRLEVPVERVYLPRRAAPEML
jgi:hypothetical protein